MKRICLMLFLLCGIYVNAQSFGASSLSVKGTYSPARPAYSVWLKQGTSDVTMKFNKNPNGITAAISAAGKLLMDNGRSLEEPDIYKSVDAPETNKVDNPEFLHNAIQKGTTKINLGWMMADGSILQLLLNKFSYEINIVGAYK